VSAAVVLPESSDPVRARFDVGGFVLGALSVGSLTFAIILGESHGYSTWWIELLFGLALLAALCFVLAELSAKNPILDVRYFKNPAFTGANVIAFTVYFGTFAIFFMVALYLQVVVQESPLNLALNFVPLAVGMVASSLFTGRWVALWGPRIPMATGCFLAGAGILLTNHMISPHVALADIGWTMFVAGVGVGMAMVPVTSAVLGSVPAEHSGMASSTTNTFRELGAVVGAAALGSVVYGQLTVDLVKRLTVIGIPKAYQSLVVSAVTTGAYQGEAKAATAKNPGIAHIVNEVVSAAYGAFGRGLHLSLNAAGALLLLSSVLALATVYGRRVHFERAQSKEGHPMHLSVTGTPTGL
jgi:predicted MFS family arabinose efflux permease